MRPKVLSAFAFVVALQFAPAPLCAREIEPPPIQYPALQDPKESDAVSEFGSVGSFVVRYAGCNTNVTAANRTRILCPLDTVTDAQTGEARGGNFSCGE